MSINKLFLSLVLILSSFNYLISIEINKEKSVVNFSAKNMWVNTVEGTIKNFKGSIDFDKNNPENSKFEVCINPATIDTDNKERDDHLKDPDFFEVEKYSTICYKSSSVIKSKDGYVTKGKLTMHGVTKDVSINFKQEGDKLFGKFELDRFDYKIGEDFNTFVIGKTIEVEIVCYLK